MKLAAERRGPGERMRRVVVKARIVRLKLGSKGADAHLRYLQRDGTDREGEKGRLYGSETDAADGRAFLERGREDRHQFRFIVAPEDGDRLSDLRAFTRDVMKQMEEDLGTKLDWVAVDHFNTGHPHSHVVIRGKDEAGKDLIIAQDYITDGVRLRAQELATLELGPETDLELRSKLTAEIAAERFTRIDRAMLAEVGEGTLDLRPETGQVRADFDRTLRIGRLQMLARYGLATESEPGVWQLSDQMEPTLRELGERGDIVKAINRALKARGEERALESYSLHGEEAKNPDHWPRDRQAADRRTWRATWPRRRRRRRARPSCHARLRGDGQRRRGSVHRIDCGDRPGTSGAATGRPQHRPARRRLRRVSPQRPPRDRRGKPHPRSGRRL